MSSATRGEIRRRNSSGADQLGACDLSSADTGALDRTQTSLATAPSWRPTTAGTLRQAPGSSRYEPPSDTATTAAPSAGLQAECADAGAVLGRIAWLADATRAARPGWARKIVALLDRELRAGADDAPRDRLDDQRIQVRQDVLPTTGSPHHQVSTTAAVAPARAAPRRAGAGMRTAPGSPAHRCRPVDHRHVAQPGRIDQAGQPRCESGAARADRRTRRRPGQDDVDGSGVRWTAATAARRDGEVLPSTSGKPSSVDR